MKRISLFFSILLLSLLASACKMGPNLPSSLATKPVQYGTLRIAIRWPQRLVTQGIPDSAQFIRLRIFRDGALVKVSDATSSVDLDEAYPRGAAGSISANRYRLPIGSGYLIEVRAYKDCPYADPTPDAAASLAGGLRITPKPNTGTDPNARIVAEGIRANETIRLPSFDDKGDEDANANNLTITLDQTVLVAGIGGTAGSNSPSLPSGIDPGNGYNAGYPNYLGDARFCELNTPDGLFFDSSKDGAGIIRNNLYFCDASTIRMVRANGMLDVLLAQGATLGIGNGRAAKSASLVAPKRLCADGSTFYLWDSGNKSVRNVVNSTIDNYLDYSKASTSPVKMASDNAAASFPDLSFNGLLDVGVRTNANQRFLYAMDKDCLLRSTNEGNWTIVAGTLNATINGNPTVVFYPQNDQVVLNDPKALLVRQDDVLVADEDGTSTTLYRIAHNGTLINAYQLPRSVAYKPLDIAAGPDDGSVYLACDKYIVKYYLNDAAPLAPANATIVAGNPAAPVLNSPKQMVDSNDFGAKNYDINNIGGLSFHAGSLYFTMGTYVYQVTDPDGTAKFVHFAGGQSPLRNGQPAIDAPLLSPGRILANADGVYVSDEGASTIYLIKAGAISRFAGGSLGSGQVLRPTSITYNKARNRIYATDIGKTSSTQNIVWEINPINFVATPVAGNPAYLSEDQLYVKSPNGIAADRAGNVYFSNTGKNRVCTIAFDPTVPIDLNSNLPSPVDINPTIIAGTGTPGKNASNIDARLVQLNSPVSVRVFDPDNGTPDPHEEIYFIDKGNNRVCKLVRDQDRNLPPVDPERRIISTVAGEGSGTLVDGAIATRIALSAPADIDLDPLGNLYIADGEKIWRVDRSGVIKLVYPRTGNGVGAFTSIAVNVAADKVLEIYFTTSGNQQVRKLYI